MNDREKEEALDDKGTGGGAGAFAVSSPTEEVLLPEVVEAIRREGGHVDVNVILVQLIKRAERPEEVFAQAEKFLEVAQKFEDHRVANFQRMSNAIIDVKTRDPDEIDKRKNNQVRRALKGVVGGCALVSLGGAITSIALGGGIVVTGLLVAVASVSLAMTGPLASGESMSSNDAVRIVNAVRGLIRRPAGAETKPRADRKHRPGHQQG